MGVYTELAAILRDADSGSSMAIGLLYGVGISLGADFGGSLRGF